MSEKMAAYLTDTMIDSIFNFLNKLMNERKENYEWVKLFTDTGNFVLNNTDDMNGFEEDLYLVFSEANLKELAKKLKGKSGYELPKLLRQELYSIIKKYDIPQIDAESYIFHFTQAIISYIEKNNHEKAMELFLGEMREENEKNSHKLCLMLENIEKQIEELKKDNVITYSIRDIDKQIRRESRYKGMGLNFFKLDDEQFETRLEKCINNETIYIVGKSREETLYRILNEIWQKYPERNTLIIKSEEEWKKLQNKDLSEHILVPFFYSEQIYAIPNNTNIFIYNEDESCNGSEKLNLRKRTMKNIVDSLEEIGLEAKEAYTIAENTRGLYVPLKKRIFNGALYDKPEWVEKHSDTVMAALLCGKWTEAEGDKQIFEELAGKKYEECKKELINYIHKENPYVVTCDSYVGKNMQLASIEDAWEELDIYITDELWEKFTELLYTVLIESEPIFEFPIEEHFMATIYAKKPEWSVTLKKGMIRTLIMRAYYRGHEENQRQIDDIVMRILNTINNKERWAYISQYIVDLCEASPDIILRKLESELKEPEGLLELFSAEDTDFIRGRHYYTNVLFAVEQLLQQKRYAVQTLEWLWKIDSYNIKYSMSNSPKELLKAVFCAWFNVSAISVEKKIVLAKKAIQEYTNAWGVIASELPAESNSLCISLNTPKYRKIDEPDVLYMNQVNETYIKYLKMCIDSAHSNEERWVEIIHHLHSYDMSIQKETLDIMLIECAEMSDSQKIKIKNELRHMIYRYRYYADSDWNMSENVLQLYETTMNEIILEDKIYDYLYIFSSNYDFPLLHPIPYSKDDNGESLSVNQISRNEEIRNRIQEFKEGNHCLEKLIELSVNEECIQLGEVLAQFYCNGKYIDEVFYLLIEKDKKGNNVYEFIKYLYMNGTVDLDEVVNEIKTISDNKNLLVNIISLEKIEDDETALISRENEDIKKIFWRTNTRFKLSERADHNTFIWALKECKKYGSLQSYLELLYDVRKKITSEELYDAFLIITDLKGEVDNDLTVYYLEEVLKELQELYITNDKRCNELATVEWACRNLLEWEQMKCMQKVMKSDPTFYAYLVGFIYKTDNNISSSEDKVALANKLYSGFDKAKFCPAEKDGQVIYEDLKRWVEKFRELLSKQKQDSLFGHLIGRLLSYSPIGDDGYSPCEAVRKIIEDNYSDSLKSSFVVEEKNKRGVYTVDAGKSELILHNRYKKNAEMLWELYPNTASIYYELSNIYKSEANFERKCAEDDF